MTDADADRLFRDAARRMPAPVAARVLLDAQITDVQPTIAATQEATTCA
jgi:hypothetical protein